MLFLFAELTDNDKPCAAQAVIIPIRGVTIVQCPYFVMPVIF